MQGINPLFILNFLDFVYNLLILAALPFSLVIPLYFILREGSLGYVDMPSESISG